MPTVLLLENVTNRFRYVKAFPTELFWFVLLWINTALFCDLWPCLRLAKSRLAFRHKSVL